MILKYTAGKCINDIFKKNLFKNNKIPIINYISENNINHSNNVLNEYMKIIDKIDYRYMLALKLSSINFNDNYLDIIINKSINKNIRIIIDAEENKNISLYREIVNDKMLIHNKDKINIIKTYQMYRKDSLYELKDDIKLFNKLNIFHSSKLVRGAYYNTEKNNGHLFNIKNKTDDNYNKAILLCYKNNSNSHILATHNNFSLKLGILLSQYKNKFILANLMGMNENFMNSQINIKKATYIPYGPYKEMIPYLSRRLYENIDQIKYFIY